MTAKELINTLEELAPPSLAMEWDNPGLLVGDADRELKSVYLALDATSDAISGAAENGCDMLITHHPMIFSPVKNVRADDFIGRRIIALIKNDITYYAMHTNFDSAVMGRIVSEKLGISVERALDPATEQEPSVGIGTVGTLDKAVTLAELALKVRREFDLPPVRYFGDGSALVGRAAICPGSGKSVASEALRAGAQVYITGDVDHHFGIDSVEKGLFVIDAGHHGLEHIFVDYMSDWFSANFPQIKISRDKNCSPFEVI